AIFGTNLMDTNNLSNYAIYNSQLYESYNSSNSPTDGSLPLQIDYTSVSFDVPSAGISVPGYISFASPTQVNVWVPPAVVNRKCKLENRSLPCPSVGTNSP
ncbi:MAG: hypothetical protein WB628_12290, partial [Candidatus Sulfotelmatobacter sp.]